MVPPGPTPTLVQEMARKESRDGAIERRYKLDARYWDKIEHFGLAYEDFEHHVCM